MILAKQALAQTYSNMKSFVVLRQPVTTLFTAAFNNPDKLTNDLLIFKLKHKLIVTLCHCVN